MAKQKENSKPNKVEEPSVSYSISQKQGVDKDFNFEAEFEKGYTLEEAKAESVRKIREWWGK